MKKIKLLILVFGLLLFTGCSNSNLKEINYKELNTLMEKGDTFILELMSSKCSACDTLEPDLNDVAKKYNLEIKYLDMLKLSKEENDELQEKLYFDGATPTILFFEDGVEDSMATRIVGAVPKDKLVNKLKDMGYIK